MNPPDEGIYLTEVKLPPTAPARVYLTRDSYEDGTLSRIVEVWSVSPRLETNELGNNALWLGPKGQTFADVLLCRVTLEAASKYFRTVPETSRECVVVPK